MFKMKRFKWLFGLAFVLLMAFVFAPSASAQVTGNDSFENAYNTLLEIQKCNEYSPRGTK